MMLTFHYGGLDGPELRLEDREDLVVIRTHRRGARHDMSPLRLESRRAQARLAPLFGVSAAGVGVWEAPPGESEALAGVLDADPEIEFAGRGLRDPYGAPIVYTENLFVKFRDDSSPGYCTEVLTEL